MTDQDDTDDPIEAQASDDEPPADEPTAPESITDDGGVTGSAAPADEPAESESGHSTGERVIGALQWGAFAILILVALIATLRFYFAASNAIDQFVTGQYRPLFQAVFNLVILLASVVGLSVLARRIT